MKLSIVYGTRPEFLKLKILIDILRISNIDLSIIKINQHNNFDEDIGYYDYIIDIKELCENRISNIGANILISLPTLLSNTTHILAQGDTATVYYSLLVGFQLKLKCIHLEAGLRTYDLENPFPEEGFRQMISRITDIHLCPSDNEKEILINEKVKGDLFVVGNTILDLVKSYNFDITSENKVLITLHRRENWDNYSLYIHKLLELCKIYSSVEFIFLSHLNPSLQKILQHIQNIPSNFKISSPIPHIELIKLLSSCLCVITDSGGIQEEANFLGKHMFVLRKVTERNMISKENITLCDINNIDTINIYNKGFNGYQYGKGNSSNNIINILNKL